MKRNLLILLLQSLIIISCITPSAASDSVDLIVVADISRSITKNMPAVKEYIVKGIFGKIAEEQDTVYIFSFDGKFYFEGKLNGDANQSEIEAVMVKVQPVGMHTDLTNAVEKMTSYIQKNLKPERKKVIYFLTDGKNDPPRFSPYWKGLKHSFFKEAKTIFTKGEWKAYFTSIGSKTDASTVAELVGAEYVELSENPTLSEFDQKLTHKLREARKGSQVLKWVLIIFGIGATLGLGFFVYTKKS
jgi:VWA domain-containing protein